MENKGGKNEVLPEAPEQAEQSFFGAVEKFPPNVEMPQVEIEGAPEQQNPAEMPPEAPITQPELTVVKNTMPVVERNAEHISKQYAKTLEAEIKQLRSHPSDFVDAINAHKGNYLDGAFGRKRGNAA